MCNEWLLPLLLVPSVFICKSSGREQLFHTSWCARFVPAPEGLVRIHIWLRLIFTCCEEVDTLLLRSKAASWGENPCRSNILCRVRDIYVADPVSDTSVFRTYIHSNITLFRWGQQREGSVGDSFSLTWSNNVVHGHSWILRWFIFKCFCK